MPDPGPPGTELPPLRGAILRTGLRVVAVVAIAFAIHLFLNWVMLWTDTMETGTGLVLRLTILGAVLTAYAVLIAVPFVPGVEIGMSLILMRGAEVAVLVYLATVAGLLLAFMVGCLVPLPWLRRIFLDLRLTRAADVLTQMHSLSPAHRLALLRRALPRRLGALAVDYRYLLLALLINLPGSGLIGGGGGISMFAGLTGLFDKRATLITIALAVLPFPLFVWFWGPGLLS